MANYIAQNSTTRQVPTPLTLTGLQNYVGGFVKFIDLPSGDLMVINEASPLFPALNEAASKIAGRTINGHVVVCAQEDIA